MNLKLNNVTLLGIDCINPSRLSIVMDLCQEKIEFAEAKLLSSIKVNDKRWVNINNISCLEDYSVFCLNNLINHVNTDYVLLVQWDGFVLNPKSWSDVFTQYDYIGSPWVVKDWAINDFDFPASWRGRRVVGNGGFCLRSKKFLETSHSLYNAGKIIRTHPEDIAVSVWYRNHFVSEGINFAPIDLAKSFAFEGGDDKYINQFGFHGYYSNINDWFRENKNRNDIYNMYLEYNRQEKSSWKPTKIYENK